MNNILKLDIKEKPFKYWKRANTPADVVIDETKTSPQYSDIKKIHVIELESENETLIALVHKDKY